VDNPHNHDEHTHDKHDHAHDEHPNHNHPHDEQHDHDDHDSAEQKHGGHGHGDKHGHEHGTVNPALYNDEAGLRAVRISTFGMLLVSIIQFAIAIVGGSAGLFADALHNTGDVLTTVALWIAFALSRRVANQRYTYGYYRAEDLAGIFIVLVIIASAVASTVESLQKLSSGQVPTQIYLSMAAAAIGIVGNEALAQYKITVGKRINSVPLIADGQHSRIDGLTSLAALIGLIGAALGYPIADAIAGLVISVVILSVVYTTSKSVIQRLLDSVDARIVPSIITIAQVVPEVKRVSDVRARWVGHTLHIALTIDVDEELTLVKAHAIAEEVRHQLFHKVEGVSEVTIHTDPYSADTDHHQLMAHHMQEARKPIAPR
jgi:cation diffusion facilitator family transporter